LRMRVVREPVVLVQVGLVLRLVPVVFGFVSVLPFHCHWEVIFLVVVEVCVVALSFPRHVHIHAVGWLWVDVGPSAVASR
jgi:hypothetical protein